MLERIEIENLASIRKTGLSLSPLTVLLGANASGKTTVMRGIELFSQLRHHSLQEVTFAGHALNGANWPTILHQGELAKRLILRATDPASGGLGYEMQLGINWDDWLSFSITEQSGVVLPEPEFLQEFVRDPGKDPISTGLGEFEIRGRPIHIRGPRHTSIANIVRQLGSIPTVHDELEGLLQYVESFGTARYFRPNSTAMLWLTAGSKVDPTGVGFVEALAALQNRQIERFESIEKRLGELFPHIRRIRFDVEKDGRNRRLVFDTQRSSRLIPAELEADGVMTTLFLLWAAATTPADGTVLVDEPEAALHPHLMGKRVEFLRSLANGEFTGYPLRVVVATQSVDFVRWLEPSEVRVVEHSQETGTLVHALPESETLRTLVDKFQVNTGELWYSGTIGGIPGA